MAQQSTRDYTSPTEPTGELPKVPSGQAPGVNRYAHRRHPVPQTRLYVIASVPVSDDLDTDITVKLAAAVRAALRMIGDGSEGTLSDKARVSVTYAADDQFVLAAVEDRIQKTSRG